LKVYYFIRLLFLIPEYNLPLEQIVIDCNYWIANFYLDLVIKNQVHYMSLIFQMDCFGTNQYFMNSILKVLTLTIYKSFLLIFFYPDSKTY
jgi:hypothetical protein